MFRRTLTGLLSVLVFAASNLLAATVTVTVRDSGGNPIFGAKAAAIAFDQATGDPSASSVFALTDGQGNATLAIPDNVDHAIIVSRQGYSPTVRDQVFDPAQQLVRGPGDVSRTVTLTPLSRVGWVQSDVVVPGPASVSSPKLVFVQVVHKTTRESVAFTVHAATAASPASTTLIVENVPVAAGGSYQVEAFVPDADVTKKAGLTQDVTPSVPDNGFAGIPGMNFADQNVAFAPDRSASAPPPGGASGKLSLEGVVVSSITGASVPNAWISIHSDHQPMDPFNKPGFWFQNMTDNSGHFSFFDIPASTYSFFLEAQAPGFEGYKSTTVVYDGSATLRQRIPLVAASGVILGRVLIRDSQGNLGPIPQVGGGAWGDWDFWKGSDKFAKLTYSPTDYHPGGGNFFSSNGDFRIEGLASGNYHLQIWTPFLQNGYTYNDGLNRTMDVDPTMNGQIHKGDDLRISVDTAAAQFTIYDSSGIQLSSAAFGATPGQGLQVILPVSSGTTGTISGTIKFVSAVTITASTPVVVMAYPQYNFAKAESSGPTASPPSGGIAVITGSGSSFSYSMSVSSEFGPGQPAKYWVEVKTREYGRQNFGPSNNQADFSNSAAVSGLDFTLAPAGIIQGRLRLPDGSIFKPSHDFNVQRWANINARGMDVESWGWGQVDDNGNFEMTGLLPGRYLITVDGYGADWLWGRGRMADVSIRAGQTVQVEVPIPPGAPIKPAPDVTQLPPPPAPVFTYRVMGVPSGTTLTADKLRQLFSEDPETAFYVGGSGRAWDTPQGVWQTLRLARGRYDFYLALSQDFGVEGESHGQGEVRGPRDSMTFLDVKRNFTVPDKLPPGVSTTTPITVQFNPVIGNASVSGKCGGKDIVRQRDMDLARQSGLDNIKALLPIVAVYDSSGGLRGFSNAYPSGLTLAAFGQMMDFVNRGDMKGFKNLFSQTYPMSYQCPRLPAGTYTLVATTKNYPPAVKKVILASGQNLTLDIDFDKDAPPPGTLRGLVTDTAKTALPLASVNIKNKATTRGLMTGPDGRYQFEGLPPGIYTITVSKDGFAPLAAKRVLVGSADFPPIVTVDFALQDGPGSVRGAVYTRGLGAAKNPPAGSRIVAYDDTLNGKKETEAVALYETKPSTDGVYQIFGLIPGHTYKVSVIVPGKVIETKAVLAVLGLVDRVDFPLKSEGARVQVRMKIESSVVKLIVESKKTLASDPDCRVSPGLSFNGAAATLLAPTTWPGNAWAYSVPSAVAGQAFTAHLETTDGASSQPEKTDVTFNPEEKARAKTRLDEAAAAGGQVPLDSTGDDVTSLDVPTGSILATGSVEISKQAEGKDGAPEYIIGGLASSLPGAEMGKNDRNLSTTFQGIAKSIMASDAYKVSLSNTQLSRPITLSLAYDVGKVDDPGKLKIYQWNETLRIWEEVPGPRVLDPVSGNVSVEVNSITEASKGTSAKGPSAGRAIHDGAQFSVNRAASTSQQATFAVFQGAPPTKIAYTGTEFQGYNFPNPFDLSLKRPPLKDGGSLGMSYPTDTATVIRYGLPAAMTGEVTFEIYNLAGELVRTINDGARDGGFLYYTDWDGKNDNNAAVTSGVYFVVAKVGGEKKKVMKFAVLK